MTKDQFHIIAHKLCRKPSQHEAAYDVLFNNMTNREAERKHGCVPNTVQRSINAIKEHFDHCNTVVDAD